MTHTHERTPIMASELQPGDLVFDTSRSRLMLKFLCIDDFTNAVFETVDNTLHAYSCYVDGTIHFNTNPNNESPFYTPTITELVRHLIRNVDPDRRMTAAVKDDVITLEYITKIYKPKHADPTLGEDKEPEVAQYIIIVDEYALPEQIELALQEIESKEVEYE